MGKIAVLIVDVQKAGGGTSIQRRRSFYRNFKRVADGARKAGAEIIYVRHDGDAEDELESGTEGWNIHGAVEPKNRENG